jgi:hypothetical protein
MIPRWLNDSTFNPPPASVFLQEIFPKRQANNRRELGMFIRRFLA